MKNIFVSILLGLMIVACNNPGPVNSELKKDPKIAQKKDNKKSQKQKKSSTKSKNNKGKKINEAIKKKKEQILKMNKNWEDEGLSKKIRAKKVYEYLNADNKKANSFEELLDKLVKSGKSEVEAIEMILNRGLGINKNKAKNNTKK